MLLLALFGNSAGILLLCSCTVYSKWIYERLIFILKHQYLKVQFFERGDCGFYMSFLVVLLLLSFVLAENRVTIAYLFFFFNANCNWSCRVRSSYRYSFVFLILFFSTYMYFCVDGFINENNHCHFHVGH